MFLKGTRGLFLCFRLNENTIDKTKKLEVEGHNFITVKCYSALNNEVTSTPLQSTSQVSIRHRECNGVIEINN